MAVPVARRRSISAWCLIVFGTGLLKPNVSVIVGQLYAPDDIRRDAGFSIFYMGINLGAFIAPLVCGYLGQRVNWHVGLRRRRRRHDARPDPVRARRASISATPACTRRRPSRRRRRAPAPADAAAGAASSSRCIVLSASAMYTGADADHRDGRSPTPPATCSSPSSSSSSAGCSSRGDWTPDERKRLYVDRRAVPRRGALLVGVRAGRIDAEPVRRSRHAQRRSSAGPSRAAGSSRSTRSSSSRSRRSSRGSGCGSARQRAVEPGEVRASA